LVRIGWCCETSYIVNYYVLQLTLLIRSVIFLQLEWLKTEELSALRLKYRKKHATLLHLSAKHKIKNAQFTNNTKFKVGWMFTAMCFISIYVRILRRTYLACESYFVFTQLHLQFNATASKHDWKTKQTSVLSPHNKQCKKCTVVTNDSLKIIAPWNILLREKCLNSL